MSPAATVELEESPSNARVNTKLLIDSLVQQTTVLIAQLSTAAGIRAPLSHVADQVFLELSRELEAQGVGRKVAADMFGLAIRTYQKKIQRITESVTVRDQTLWQAVLEHLSEKGSATRRAIQNTFARDDSYAVASVLNDLVSSGLVYRTGTGDSTLFGLTAEHDLAQTLREQQRDGLAPIIWVVVHRSGGLTRAQLLKRLAVEEEQLDRAVDELHEQGRLTRDGHGDEERYSADTFLVPVGSEQGWEAAVLDHFQAMARAIAHKVRSGKAKSEEEDVLGGATLTFDVHPEHPHREAVRGLLRQVRENVNELWNTVQDYNDEHPPPEDQLEKVSFYFGQTVIDQGEGEK